MKELALIKNLGSFYRLGFRQLGSVLVGSFLRYRYLEGHSGDKDEGIKGFSFAPEENTTLYGDKLNSILPGRFVNGDSFQVRQLNIKYTIPDAYVFCVSSQIDTSFGNSHYKIINYSGFGQVLFETLRTIDNQVYYWKLGKVEYGGLKDPIHTLAELYSLKGHDFINATYDDYFHKSSKYARDNEYRFVFFTRNSFVPKNVQINNMALTSFCTFN